MQFFKKKTEPLLLSTGRELGKWSDEKKETFYLLGSAHGVFRLPEEQYVFWKELKASSSLSEWKRKVGHAISSNQDFTEALAYFQERKLLTLIYSKDDNQLSQFRITRNGIGTGNHGEQWIVGSYDSKEMINLTKEQYLMWICADGLSNIPQVLKQMERQLGCPSKKAFEVFIKHVKVFIIKGLWSIEYTNATHPSNRSSKSRVIARDEILLPVGQEVGKLDDSDNYYLSVGGSVSSVSTEEYAVWTLIRQNHCSLSDLAGLFEMEEVDLLDTIVKPLLEKGLIISWKKEFIKNESSLRLIPTGISLVASSKEMLMTTCSVGKVKKLPLPIQILWGKAGPDQTLQQLSIAYQDEMGCTNEEALDYLEKFIPFLIHNGLAVLNGKDV